MSEGAIRAGATVLGKVHVVEREVDDEEEYDCNLKVTMFMAILSSHRPKCSFILQIGLPQGLKMLQFFKSYPLARSLLDDFEFYEQKERSAMEERRRQQQLSQTEAHLEAELDQMSI
ncbi:hypothetical protein KSP40_PGU017319 [Platanthera guangdongensis]|uniref:Uncharacterized protein n=1 Tax=Platanthera guangdongensis TaxID=2320717 RepID=A0ABR2MWR9_9ASPA